MQSQWGPISAAHDIALKSVASPNEKAFPLGSLSQAVEGAYAIGPNGRVPVTLMGRRYGPTNFNLNCNIATCWDAHAANWPGFSGSPIFDQFDNFIGLLVGGYDEIDGVALVVAGIDVREVISYAHPWFEQDVRRISDIEDPRDIRHVSFKGMNFLVEIAATPAEHRSGLAHREALASNAGMLFVFSWESVLIFWMKGVLIPLDILYMDAAGVIVDIHTMIPEPGVSDSELRTYPSAAPAQYALVVNAGVAESHGFSVGDEASFR